MAADLTQARIAENQSVFRRANEKIGRTAGRLELEGEVPFICECAERRCTEIIRLSLATYAEVRSNPRRFFNAPGHEALSVQNGAGVVVEEHERYVLVDKVGVAGEVAAAEHERGVRPGG